MERLVHPDDRHLLAPSSDGAPQVADAVVLRLGPRGRPLGLARAAEHPGPRPGRPARRGRGGRPRRQRTAGRAGVARPAQPCAPHPDRDEHGARAGGQRGRAPRGDLPDRRRGGSLPLRVGRIPGGRRGRDGQAGGLGRLRPGVPGRARRHVASDRAGLGPVGTSVREGRTVVLAGHRHRPQLRARGERQRLPWAMCPVPRSRCSTGPRRSAPS